MKIRTKLVLLLSAALVVTMTVSTLLRIRWTRTRLETQLRNQAQDAADAIAADLTRQLTPDKDDEDISEELKKAMLRHPTVAGIRLNFDTDEETTATFELPSKTVEPTVKKNPKEIRSRGPGARRDDARRALYDHGENSRRPLDRIAEPLWRTRDRLESSRLPVRPVPAQHAPHVFYEGRHGLYEAHASVEPTGPRHGELTVSVIKDPIEQLIRHETVSSILITGAAVGLLVLLATFIVARVVGRPVSELQLAMARVEGGALDERVEPRSSDEVGALSRGFNSMLERLAQADKEIRAFNRRLADEVRAATVDLARKNDALGQLNRLLLETRRELGDKERLAALGQLAAQLAHEIGTPLGSVSGHLQLGIADKSVAPELKERLQVATRELERVSKIVRDYLDSTRGDLPERVPVELGRVVEEALGIALGGEAHKRVRAEQRIELGGTVRTDAGLVRQILVNLLTNAADAVVQSGGGRIWVEARRHGGWVELTVRDDGMGITPEDVSRIFEPFYTTKGRGKGTGLGLSICRELASALGGRITVASSPGRGSTFTVTLPDEAEPSQAAAVPQAAAGASASRRAGEKAS